MQRKRPHHTGFNLIELAIVLLVIVLIAAALLPSIQHTRNQSMVDGSMNNLVQLGIAHMLYGADWNDKQWSPMPHNIALFGNTMNSAFSSYCNWFSHANHCHWGTFASWLGTSPHPDTGNFANWLYSGAGWALPINFSDDFSGGPSLGFGSFRMNNVKSFNSYVDGRVYSPTFYAPKDTVVIDSIGECWDAPMEFCLLPSHGGHVKWSSYVLSPAAMYHPEIWSVPEGHFPQYDDALFSQPNAFHVPSYSHALHPSKKTHILEHHWLQNNYAGKCNPQVPPAPGDYNGCTPYYFNHSLQSAPATLFYDMHVRLLPNTEAWASDQQAGLWRRDTAWGQHGYFSEFSVPGTPRINHHILTKNGIQGRDTLGPDVDTSNIQFASPVRRGNHQHHLAPMTHSGDAPDSSSGLSYVPVEEDLP